MSQSVENIVGRANVAGAEHRRKGLITFFTVWFGQTVSVIGSGLTGFALGVWAYQVTGSATRFSLIVLCTVAPGIVLSPLLGVIVDRYDRRMIMVLSNIVAGICTAVMAVLYLQDSLRLWHIYTMMIIISISSSLLGPSYTASISSMVHKEFLGRASGMAQFGAAASDMIAPLLAGALVVTIHVHGILIIDFATYVFAVSTLLFIRFPEVSRKDVPPAQKISMLSEVAVGMRYLRARPGLLALIGFFTMTNFVLAMDNVLIPPMVISFGGAAIYGIVAAVGGAGMLFGSLAMSIWGGPKQRIFGVYLYGLILGTALFLEGLRPNAWLIATAAFIAAFVAPLANSCAIPILQSKTELAVQGRVFTTMRFLAGCSVPFSYVLAGRLADKVFEPLMASNGALSSSLGRFLGVGPGRGVALLLLILGVSTFLLTLKSLSYKPLRKVESQIPDAVG